MGGHQAVPSGTMATQGLRAPFLVIPDVGSNPAFEVRIAGLLFAEDVGNVQEQHIHLAFDPIQNGNTKGMILIAYCACERPQMRCSAAGLRSQRPPNN